MERAGVEPETGSAKRVAGVRAAVEESFSAACREWLDARPDTGSGRAALLGEIALLIGQLVTYASSDERAELEAALRVTTETAKP